MARNPNLRVVAGFTAILSQARIASAWAQDTPPAAGTEGSLGISGAVVVMMVLALVIAVATAGIKLLDLKRRRSEEAAALQGRLSDSLITEPELVRSPVAAIAEVPLRGTPVTVRVSGRVATPELREAALRVVERELAVTRPDAHVEDALQVDPELLHHHAA